MDEFDKVFPDLLQKITHSGEKRLDDKQIKKIEQLTGSSPKHCKLSYQQIMRHLEKKHSEVRFSTLLVCDYLVRHNKAFRKLLIGEDMTKFLELTLGTNKSSPLPPPKIAAKELHSKALSVIFNWNTDFGKKHMELANAYFFLKDCLKVDFVSLERKRDADKIKAENEKKRLIAKKEEKLKRALKEFKDNFEETQGLCTELESCISLLLPTPEDFFLSDVNPESAINSEAGSSSSSSLRAHGIVTAGTSIRINLSKSIPKVVIDEDNEPIVETARDLHRQLSKSHVKRILLWTEAFENQADHVGKYQTCKCLDEQLKRCMAQFDELGLRAKNRLKSESSDDDLEEVSQKEGYEEKVTDDLLASIIAAKSLKAKESEKPKEQKKAEKRPAKVDLPVEPKEKMPTSIEDWEKRTVALPPVIVGNRPDNSQVWIGPSVEDSEEIKVPIIQSCPVEISSNFEPVKWACRAPLPNGLLCPRQDRYKCPFHGKVVPRDESGKCTRAEDAKAEILKKEKHRLENPDWQDPKLLAEIKKATGIDLEIPKKGQRRKKPPEFPGLTDITKKKDSPRKRLARKVLTRAELRQLTSKLEIEPEEVREREFYLSDDSDD